MMQTIWQEFLTIVREEVGSRVVETWFKAVRYVQWDNYKKIVYLEAPNQFVKDWLTGHYNDLFVKHFSRLLNESSVSIVISDVTQAQSVVPVKTQPVIQKNPELYTAAKSLRNAPVVAEKIIRTRTGLNSGYIFDSFVVGTNNKLAFAAAQAVSEKPGKLYNPLFIYGPSGLGKTHLLHAIGNNLRDLYPGLHILYQSADRFVNEFINAIRFDKVYQFETRYKDVDVLLMDDIQFISNKEQTQEAFFHIFNAMHQAQKQIVFTSDSLPCDIAGLAERMRSRLEGGLITDIQIPAFETKMAILKKKASLNHEELTDDVAEFIASQAYNNIRELEGALIRVLAYCSLTKQPISLEIVHKVFNRTKPYTQQSPDLMTIAERVMNVCNVSLSELRSTKRDKESIFARHLCMYLMKKHTDHSLKDIGMFLARRDHTTVIHAFEKITMQRTVQQELNDLISKIEQNFARL